MGTMSMAAGIIWVVSRKIKPGPRPGNFQREKA